MIDFLLIVLLFPLIIIVPGAVCSGRLRLEPMERLVVAIGASIFLIYLICTALFLLDAPPITFYVITAAIIILAIVSFRRIVAMFNASDDVKRACWYLLIAGLWVFSLLTVVRLYTGAAFYGDWIDHIQRAHFFQRLDPVSEDVHDRIPRRPPLFNVVAGYMMSHTSGEFYIYQIWSICLNSLSFLPMYLFARTFSRNKVRPLWTVLLLFAASPIVVQNTLYTWTRGLTNFYVLTGLYFHYTSLSEKGRLRPLLSFAFVSLGCVTHYSAAVYLLFIGMHRFALAFANPRGWRDLAAGGAVSALVLGTWFGWAIPVFGTQRALEATTSAEEASRLSLKNNVMKVGQNIRTTLVPPFLRKFNTGPYRVRSPLGFLREYTFILYQQNFFFAFGSIGWALLIFEISKRMRCDAVDRGKTVFWMALTVWALFLGIGSASVVGGNHAPGLAHICLQPVVMTGLALMAAGFAEWGVVTKAIGFLGIACDWLLGVVLSVYRLSLVPSDSADESSLVRDFTVYALKNFKLKADNEFVYLGDVLQEYQPYLLMVLIACLGIILIATFGRRQRTSNGLVSHGDDSQANGLVK
jgi:hypothetical protein